ncbi:MAG: hypothetical protein DRJ42_17965 [Deltaproteobacteria bacterium]|nr:MAG: hypothetical protein DRJ42_17965 [Deltaproteobacteria bacterium]
MHRHSIALALLFALTASACGDDGHAPGAHETNPPVSPPVQDQPTAADEAAAPDGPAGAEADELPASEADAPPAPEPQAPQPTQRLGPATSIDGIAEAAFEGVGADPRIAQIIDHGRYAFVLFTARPEGADYARFTGERHPRRGLYLARVLVPEELPGDEPANAEADARNPTAPVEGAAAEAENGGEAPPTPAENGAEAPPTSAALEEDLTPFVREDGILLYEYAVGEEQNYCDNADFSPENELRARDIDHDREVEITVIAGVAALPHRPGNSNDRCGTVAFIVGADDLDVQARFTRAYYQENFAAGSETELAIETRWRLDDLDSDGHPDLHVIESYRFVDDFMGDDIGDGETAAPEHSRGSDRRTVDCLYDTEADRWACPPTPVVGAQLFQTLEQLLDPSPGISPPSW